MSLLDKETILLTETGEQRQTDVGTDGGDEAYEPRQRSWLHRVIALVTMLAVGSFLLAAVIRPLLLPPLDFLGESRSLEQDPQVRRWREAVVLVRAHLPASTSSGTGFNIDRRGLIMTNRHVVDGADYVTVSFGSGATYYADVVIAAEKLDLALIKLQADDGLDNLPTVKPAPGAPPPVGSEVTIIGNPFGLPAVALRGEVAGYRSQDSTRPEMMTVAAEIRAGHSGSPVFDDDGEVVGIIFAVMNDRSEFGLAITAASIREFVAATSNLR